MSARHRRQVRKRKPLARVRKVPAAGPARPTTALRERAVRILDILEQTHPEARCALDYRNPFELSVATILSAQCTDERVNRVTPVLFDRFPTAAALAGAPLPDVESIIRSTGFFRAKARSIVGFARALEEKHGGVVPRAIATLVHLPGFGRKTANVVAGHAYGVNEGIAVDTHVLRVTNRLGLVSTRDPIDVEARLMQLVPQDRWTRTTDLFIFHGRKICDARRPECGRCPVFSLCRFEDRRTWARGAKPTGAAPTRAPRTGARAR